MRFSKYLISVYLISSYLLLFLGRSYWAYTELAELRQLAQTMYSRQIYSGDEQAAGVDRWNATTQWICHADKITSFCSSRRRQGVLSASRRRGNGHVLQQPQQQGDSWLLTPNSEDLARDAYLTLVLTASVRQFGDWKRCQRIRA